MLPINSSSSRNCAESFAFSKNILFFVMRLSPKRTHQALPEGECGIRTERRAHSHLRHCVDCVREMQLCGCSGPDRHDLSAVVLSQVSCSPEARCSAPQPKPVLRTREASGNDKDPCFVATRHRYNVRSKGDSLRAWAPNPLRRGGVCRSDTRFAAGLARNGVQRRRLAPLPPRTRSRPSPRTRSALSPPDFQLPRAWHPALTET